MFFELEVLECRFQNKQSALDEFETWKDFWFGLGLCHGINLSDQHTDMHVGMPISDHLSWAK